MGSEQKVMGIPQLVHFQTLITTGALFLGLISLKFVSTEVSANNIAMTVSIAVLALFLLIFSADFFIEGAKGLARRGGLPEVVIGLTIVSIGTSLPEILVTSSAASTIGDDPALADFAIGGILGSVFVQITLIMGIVVVNRGLKIRESWLKRDGQIMLLSVLILSFFLITEGTLRTVGSGHPRDVVCGVHHLAADQPKGDPGRGTGRQLMHPKLQGSSTGAQQHTL